MDYKQVINTDSRPPGDLLQSYCITMTTTTNPQVCANLLIALITARKNGADVIGVNVRGSPSIPQKKKWLLDHKLD